jgi:large repetitive protein
MSLLDMFSGLCSAVVPDLQAVLRALRGRGRHVSTATQRWLGVFLVLLFGMIASSASAASLSWVQNTYQSAGQVLTVNVTATRITGDTITGVAITNGGSPTTTPTLSNLTCPSLPAAISTSVTCTANYTVTAADITRGTICLNCGTSGAGNNTVRITFANAGVVLQAVTSLSITTFDSIPPATVTSISPTSGPATGGTTVTIRGTNFQNATGVRLSGSSGNMTGFRVIDATTIEAVTTAAVTSGPKTVTVILPDRATTGDRNASLSSAFTYVAGGPAPTITGITPDFGPISGGTNVTITGTNLTNPVSGSINNPLTNVVRIDDNSVTARTASTLVRGPANVNLTTGGAGSATLTNGFTFLEQMSLSGLSVNNGPLAGGNSITINGDNLDRNRLAVRIGGVIATQTAISTNSVTVTVPAGTAPGAVNVRVENELFNATLTNAYTYNAPPLPTASIGVTPNSVSEDGATNLVYTVTLSAAQTTDTTVNITTGGTATAGTDYTGSVSTLVIPIGSTTGSITINPSVDGTVETDETVALTVAAGTGYTVGAPSVATGTILNDDVPAVSIAVAPADVTEDGTPNLVYTVTLSQPAFSATTVNYTVGGTATNGTDYATITSPLVIPAGNVTGTITVNPTADTTIESDETVTLTLAAGTGYTVGAPGAATGNILNDDLPNLTINDVTFNEGNSGTTDFTFTVSLSAPAGRRG